MGLYWGIGARGTGNGFRVWGFGGLEVWRFGVVGKGQRASKGTPKPLNMKCFLAKGSHC